MTSDNPESLAPIGLYALMAAEKQKRKAEQTPPTDTHTQWDRERYINSQFDRVVCSDSEDVKLQVTADLGQGDKTNWLNLYLHQLSAVRQAVLNTADPFLYDGIPVRDEVSVDTIGHTINGEWVFSHHLIDFHDLRIILRPTGTDDHHDESSYYVYSIACLSMDENFQERPVLDLWDSEDQHLIERILWEAFPSEHCQHEYDCCGHLYRNSPDFLYMTNAVSNGNKRLSHIGIGYTRNI